MMNGHDEDDKMSPPNSYDINSPKFPVENIIYPRNFGKSYVEGDEVDNDDDVVDFDDGNDDDDDDDGGDGVQRIGYGSGDDDFGDLERHSKKRKLKTLVSNYEFAPRLPEPSSSSAAKPSYGRRNPLLDWTERETFILLDAWGERFLKQGRKSLRTEEWREVADKASQHSKIGRSDTQCRNRLDTLKKKYKKEKMKVGENGNSACKWIYFKKMDELLSWPQQQADLSCGVDLGEFAFLSPKAYLNQSNGAGEMRGGSGTSESGGGGEDESEGLQLLMSKDGGRLKGSRTCFKLLADSILKFSDIYEKIETSRRQQMVELEKMQMDFRRDLEFEKREIVERAQAEIEKIRQRNGGGDNDASYV